MNPQPQDPLDALLKSASAEVNLPPRFQAEVWQRIADRATDSPWQPVRAWLEQWAAILTRPRYALALVAVAILVGAGAAQIQATRDYSDTMQARYVSMIDPYTPRAR